MGPELDVVCACGLSFSSFPSGWVHYTDRCTGIFGMMKSSQVYEQALAMAKTHPAVLETIGSPVEAGMFMTGSINTSGPSGEADIAIPISGPDGKATVYVQATKSEGQWIFSVLSVRVKKSGKRIDLLEQSGGPE